MLCLLCGRDFLLAYTLLWSCRDRVRSTHTRVPGVSNSGSREQQTLDFATIHNDHPRDFAYDLETVFEFAKVIEMVTFNLSYTAPVNPPGAEPVLTQSQIWECIKRKVRHAEQFVPAITQTEILSESKVEGEVVSLQRRITFAPGGHPAGAENAVETCRFFAPCRVDFVAADGSAIINAVSVGPTAQPDDLNYTYIFEWRHPDLKANTREAEIQKEADWKVGNLHVQRIEIRALTPSRQLNWQ